MHYNHGKHEQDHGKGKKETPAKALKVAKGK